MVDLPVDHPSCSSQHAVLQYRLVNYEKKDGSTGKRVRYTQPLINHVLCGLYTHVYIHVNAPIPHCKELQKRDALWNHIFECRPYLIDLESTNGTYINNQRIESARYWELKEKVHV